MVVRRLEEAGIEYMLTGSMASSLQGEPRATHDIDIVVAIREPAPPMAARLKTAFPEPEFYPDEAAVREAISERGMFNLIVARLGGSEKQFHDAVRVYEVQHGRLEEAYLDRWAVTLAVVDALARLRAEARPIEWTAGGASLSRRSS